MNFQSGFVLGLIALLSPSQVLAEPARDAAQAEVLMMGASDADDLLGKALYTAARAYALKGNKEETYKALKKLLDEVPRHEMAAEASYRVGNYLFFTGRYVEAERYLIQAQALFKPHELTQRLAVLHDLAWTRYKQERVADALLEAKRFSAGVAGEPLLADPVSRGAELTAIIRSVTKLVAIVESCHHGKTLEEMKSDAAFASDFGALLPFLEEPYAAKSCAVQAVRK